MVALPGSEDVRKHALCDQDDGVVDGFGELGEQAKLGLDFRSVHRRVQPLGVPHAVLVALVLHVDSLLNSGYAERAANIEPEEFSEEIGELQGKDCQIDTLTRRIDQVF